MSSNGKNSLAWGGIVWDRILTVVLVLAIVGALGMLIYVIAVPRSGEKVTEFYLLSSSGRAEGYPNLLAVGGEGQVLAGIINRQQETTTYRLQVRIDGVINNEVGPVTLEHDERWQEVVSFTPSRIGDKQKVEFLLYKQGQSEAYRKLHLWLDVR